MGPSGEAQNRPPMAICVPDHIYWDPIIFEPEIGQHTSEILEGWLGFNQQTIKQMRENRVIS